MGAFFSLLFATCVWLALAIHGVEGGAMVTGSVFCDQCKDGQVTLFDYPLSGMKVAMVCPGNDGQMSVVGEATTTMLGGYAMSFDGTPNLQTCNTQITPNVNGSGPNNCGSVLGPPKPLKLMFSMFNMEMYSVDPLISQPAQPMSMCSSSSSSPNPVPQPPPVSSTPPPAVGQVTPPPTIPRGQTPTFKLPPLPPMPPAPFLDFSACSHEYWLKPEYKCYWRGVSPDLTVGLVFGPVAAQKYGNGLTLRSGLQGRGSPYSTLLREAITSLLNSYNSLRFTYNAPQVLYHFNFALTGSSTRNLLLTALRFKRANSGSAHNNSAQSSCKFTPCK